jgi:hypothetical protein
MLATAWIQGIVCAMIGNKLARQNHVDNFFTSFRGRFLNPHDRLAAARTLLPDVQEKIDWMYATRTVLAAQWADELPEARATARLLYSLSPTLERYMGESVVRLTGASPQDIKAMSRGAAPPSYGLSLDLGAIDEKTEIEYAFRRTPHQNIPEGVQPEAKFLDFQVSLNVRTGPTLELSPEGNLEAGAPVGERTDFIAYAGSVCLEMNRTLYHQTKRTEVGNLAFGNARAFGLVYETLKGVGGEQFDTFQELFDDRQVAPELPLTTLDMLLYRP